VTRVDTCTWVTWVYIMKSLNRDFTEQYKILPIKCNRKSKNVCMVVS